MQPATPPARAGHSIKQKQYAVYAALLLVVSILVAGGYRMLNSAQILYRKAENLYNSEAFSQAAPLYEKALDAGLKNENAVQRLFQAYLAQGRGREAQAAFERLPERSKDIEAVVALAEVYESERRWDEAIVIFQRYESLWIQSPTAMMRLADLYLYNADFETAQHWYRRSLKQSPASLYARFRLAETLAWTKRYEEAIALLRGILSDHPQHRLTRLTLARMLGWSGRLEEAIVEYQILLGDST